MFSQPLASVPDKVYVVVTLGLAVGLDELDELNVAPLSQLYTLAPLADKVTLSPSHIT